MAIKDTKMVKDGGTASKVAHFSLAPAINLAAAPVRVLQVPFPFTVDGVQAWARVLAGAVTAIVGIVRPGRSIEAVTMGIGAVPQDFKITAAFTGVAPTRIGVAAQPLNLPLVFRQAIQDNIPFTLAQTINVAAVAGQYWGAWRIQRSPAGVISTKARATDQNYVTEPGALNAVPAADAGYFDLGTITIRSAAGVAFTTNTTSLAAAGTTVNYNGVTSGFVNVATTNPVYVSATFVRAPMALTQVARSVAQNGGLIVVECTTDGAGALTDGTLDVTYRPWPLNGESAPRGA